MMILTGQLALAVAALFSGAALYINVAEQPARLALDESALLTQWKPAYRRGFVMQSSLAILGFVLGLLTWWQTSEWAWLAGALAMIANWPFTMLVILPTNRELMATDPAAADARTRALIQKWAGLHAVRTGLGFLATVLFVWASLR